MRLRETAERATVRTQRLRDSAESRARRLPWARLALRSFEREQRSGAGLLAGGLAYRLFFWLVSFGLITAPSPASGSARARGASRTPRRASA